MLCPGGQLLRNPGENQLARCVGLVGPIDADQPLRRRRHRRRACRARHAVYAGSEGLSVLAIDCRSFGGQAGASARIENYLGFPTGISGMALMGRAFSQAQKFGVEMAIPDEAVKLECGNDPCHVQLATGERVQARAVVIATGRALSPARGRAARGVRRLVGPLLGLAAGSRACARTRTSRWSAAAIRRARRRSSSPAARGA